jgi:DNA-binding PadR family transcriptional regulator
MTVNNLSPEDMLPLTPAVFHILLSLADGEKHGYAIMQTVEDMSDGRVKMGPGTLYGSIKRMQKNNLIVETDQRPDPQLDDERRRYYKLTDFGQRVATLEAYRLHKLVNSRQSRRLLGDA